MSLCLSLSVFLSGGKSPYLKSWGRNSDKQKGKNRCPIKQNNLIKHMTRCLSFINNSTSIYFSNYVQISHNRNAVINVLVVRLICWFCSWYMFARIVSAMHSLNVILVLNKMSKKVQNMFAKFNLHILDEMWNAWIIYRLYVFGYITEYVYMFYFKL